MTTYPELEASSAPRTTRGADTRPAGVPGALARRTTPFAPSHDDAAAPRSVVPGSTQLEMAGVSIDLVDFSDAVRTIVSRASESWERPLAVVSANLDHVHHFGRGSRWQGVLEHARTAGELDVLTLLDGMPLVRQAGRMTGREWPRLAGSDLIGPLLDAAEAGGLSVGFLGGLPETHEQLRGLLAERRPGLDVAGFWAPERAELTDREASAALAADIAAAGVDILAVCLGKPRQELWIAEHGAATGAGALLAFGAAVDFLAEKVSRAPEWISGRGMEWTYRLVQEPRRLARRYLVQGPPSYWAVRVHNGLVDPARHTGAGVSLRSAPAASASGPWLPVREETRRPAYDVTAVVVTHNSARDVAGLITSLRAATDGLRLRVVAVDNESVDATADVLAAQRDVTVIEAPGNLGYAAGINLAMAEIEQGGEATTTRSILVLNPDLRLAPGALRAMWERLWRDGVGAVVPQLRDCDGGLDHSLHFEPTAARTMADALLGSHLPARRPWLSEMDWHAESYLHPHPVEWATGACVLMRRTTAHHVGPWDERYFLYSEEVDFLRRVRESGWTTWYEPAASATHVGGGSGSSAELDALLVVNRVRYVEATRGRWAAELVRGASLVGALLRLGRGAGPRTTARYLLSRRSWHHLPAATPIGWQQIRSARHAA